MPEEVTLSTALTNEQTIITSTPQVETLCCDDEALMQTITLADIVNYLCNMPVDMSDHEDDLPIVEFSITTDADIRIFTDGYEILECSVFEFLEQLKQEKIK